MNAIVKRNFNNAHLPISKEMAWASVPLDRFTPEKKLGKLMAIYHLNLRHCSKNNNQSAAAKYEYITRDEKYSNRKEDLKFSGYGNLPTWANDNPKIFWQKTDELERANARLCSEIEFALPRELNIEQQKELINDFISKTINTNDRNLTYSFGVHNDKNNNNPHCHLIFSERQNDGIERTAENYFKRANKQNPELGGAAKNRTVKSKNFLKEIRTTWAEVANEHLKQSGVISRIDERTLQEQGIEREPRARIDRITFKKIQSQKQELTAIDKEIRTIKNSIEDVKTDEKLKIFDFDNILEQQKIAMKQEQEKLLEKVRILNAIQAEKEQAEREQVEREQAERERAERERAEREQAERERAERERAEREQVERERAEREQAERERLERERLERAKKIEQQRSTPEQKKQQRIFDNLILKISRLSERCTDENKTLQRYEKELVKQNENLTDVNDELDYLKSENLGIFGLYKSKSQKEKMLELERDKTKLEKSINEYEQLIKQQNKTINSVSKELKTLNDKKADELAKNHLLVEKTVEQAQKDIRAYLFGGSRTQENTIQDRDSQKSKYKEHSDDFSL